MHHRLAAYPGGIVLDRHKGRDYAARIERPWLSIKCMFGGAARYRTDEGRHYRVDDDVYLVLAKGHGYAVEKAARTPVETFCVFLPPALDADVRRGLVTPASGLLDDPEAVGGEAAPIEGCRRQSGDLAQRLAALRRAAAAGPLEPLQLEEALTGLAAGLWLSQADHRQRAERLPAVRAAARMETYRRLVWARDFIHAHLDEPLTLARIAAVARLSPFHLLRAFRQVFGATPRAYLAELRLTRARRLIAEEGLSITEAALAVGYESLPSFSKGFRRRFGLAPSAARAPSKPG